MHYCYTLFTKEKPTYDEIENILAPYYEPVVYEKDEKLPILIWDWYMIGGRYSHILDGEESLHTSDIKDYDTLQTYGLIDVDKTVYAKEYWNGIEWLRVPDYWEKFEEIKKRNKDCWVTILDIHD